MMEKVLKPARLDLDANVLDVAKQWQHWGRTFENFLAECSENVPQGGLQANNLLTLTNYVPHSVFEHIDEIDDYDQCIAKLEALCCKPPNEIFVRHCLATRRQEPGESIDQFLVTLKKLPKDCNLQMVTAEVYRDKLVRDSFISGLSSSYVRQRLLEHKTLTQDEAYRHALALKSAQKNSNAYNLTSHITAIHMVKLDDDAPGETIYDSVTSKINTEDSTPAATNNNTTSRKKCRCRRTLWKNLTEPPILSR